MTGVERARCSAMSKQSGEQCRNLPSPGAAVCRFHGGKAPQVRAAAARRLALGEAMAELDRLGRPIDVEPADAMLEMVREAAGNVAFLRAKVQELDHFDAGPQGEEILAVLGGGGKDGREVAAKAPAAIYARTSPADWKAAPHVLVSMYDAERERLVRWAKACRDAGVDERRVRVAEEQGRQIAQVLHGALGAALALVVDLVGEERAGVVREAWSREVPGIVRREIGAVTGEAAA